MASFGPYPARVVAVHDGDTCTLDIDLGFDHIIKGQDLDGATRLACRVFGINAPELSTAAGKSALAYALTIMPVGTKVQVTSYGWDKYGGRFDGSLILPNGSSFSDLMISSGHATQLLREKI